MKECNCDLRDGDAKTAVFGSNEMLQPAPVDTIPMNPTTRNFRSNSTPSEPGHFRYHLHGRLCHQTDERSHQHQLH